MRVHEFAKDKEHCNEKRFRRAHMLLKTREDKKRSIKEPDRAESVFLNDDSTDHVEDRTGLELGHISSIVLKDRDFRCIDIGMLERNTSKNFRKPFWM